MPAHDVTDEPRDAAGRWTAKHVNRMAKAEMARPGHGLFFATHDAAEAARQTPDRLARIAAGPADGEPPLKAIVRAAELYATHAGAGSQLAALKPDEAARLSSEHPDALDAMRAAVGTTRAAALAGLAKSLDAAAERLPQTAPSAPTLDAIKRAMVVRTDELPAELREAVAKFADRAGGRLAGFGGAVVIAPGGEARKIVRAVEERSGLNLSLAEPFRDWVADGRAWSASAVEVVKVGDNSFKRLGGDAWLRESPSGDRVIGADKVPAAAGGSKPAKTVSMSHADNQQRASDGRFGHVAGRHAGTTVQHKGQTVHVPPAVREALHVQQHGDGVRQPHGLLPGETPRAATVRLTGEIQKARKGISYREAWIEATRRVTAGMYGSKPAPVSETEKGGHWVDEYPAVPKPAAPAWVSRDERERVDREAAQRYTVTADPSDAARPWRVDGPKGRLGRPVAGRHTTRESAEAHAAEQQAFKSRAPVAKLPTGSLVNEGRALIAAKDKAGGKYVPGYGHAHQDRLMQVSGELRRRGVRGWERTRDQRDAGKAELDGLFDALPKGSSRVELTDPRAVPFSQVRRAWDGRRWTWGTAPVRPTVTFDGRVSLSMSNPGNAVRVPAGLEGRQTRTKEGLPVYWYWKDIIEKGHYTHPWATKGMVDPTVSMGAGDPYEYDVTPERMDHWVRSFKRMRAMGITVPFVKNHGDRDEDTIGTVEDMVRKGDKIRALHRVVGDDAAALVERNNSSIQFGTYRHARGPHLHDVLLHNSTAQRPVGTNLGGFERVDGPVELTLREAA